MLKSSILVSREHHQFSYNDIINAILKSFPFIENYNDFVIGIDTVRGYGQLLIVSGEMRFVPDMVCLSKALGLEKINPIKYDWSRNNIFNLHAEYFVEGKV